MSVDFKRFVPAWWLQNAHLQTIFPMMYLKKKYFPERQERFELPDGDFIDAVWTDKSQGPIVVLLHGLQGSSNSHYIHSLMHDIYYQTNWTSVAINLRGCGEYKQRTSRQYHGGDTEDIKFIINLIKQRYPDQPLAIVGYSLGGNLLLKLFGELKYHNLCETGVAISPPFDMKKCALKIRKGINTLYQKAFLDDIKKSLLYKFTISEDIHKLKNKLNQLKSLIDFDNQITAPMHGYQSVDEYYRDVSCRFYLPHIRKPTLIVLACDDPIVDYSELPDKSDMSSHIKLEAYTHGGHVGFMSGNLSAPKFWVNERVLSHLSEYLPLGVHETEKCA
ncbi:MAG: hydrolase [Pseudomonadota bacterium]|nr:hydrolase [Pseudomonadota bacterium]